MKIIRTLEELGATSVREVTKLSSDSERLAVRSAILYALMNYYCDGGTRPVEQLIGQMNG